MPGYSNTPAPGGIGSLGAATPQNAASGAASGTHAPVGLGGPLYVALRIIGYLVPLAALAVTIDSLRRPASAFGGRSGRRWLWAGPQLLLLVLIAFVSLVTFLKAMPMETIVVVSGFVAFYGFIAAALQIAYLLVVVFPRHRGPSLPSQIDTELPNL